MMNMRYDEASVRKDYEKLTKRLIRKNLTVTTMESATAGQIASLLTDTEGSSEILKGAFVTYSNEAKAMQGVPEDVLVKYSAYSRECACAMAQACRNAYNADIGIGVTGTFGNTDPRNEEYSVPGEVYFAVSTEERTESYFVTIPRQPTRHAYKVAAAKEVYDVVIEVVDR
ncbi:MAG: CinA family protein [Lachnospiraceae bacterium]|jgi:PncC family amidohydrolase